jgi:hypothetical protein
MDPLEFRMKNDPPKSGARSSDRRREDRLEDARRRRTSSTKDPAILRGVRGAAVWYNTGGPARARR